MHNEIQLALASLALEEKAAFYPKFFKAGPGQYAEGDKFIGVTVPDQRKVAKAFYDKISIGELAVLLASKIHEHRHTALLILVLKFEKSKSAAEQKEIADFYLLNIKFINNWDLVDNSAYKIIGRYCYENKQDDILIKLADEENLWNKRIAVVATMHYIKKGSFELTKTVAIRNLQHPHDLMHKANGWLLREMGNKNETELINFLALHYKNMPRTSLRYAIEKLDEEMRQDYLKGRV